MNLYILILLAVLTANPTEATMHKADHILSFGEDDQHVWSIVNDGVMGGISRSAMQRTADGTGLFTGNLSLENNGGFASVRTSVAAGDLAECPGLRIRVRGDGRTYQLRLRVDDRFDGVAYRALFETRDQTWQTIDLPFAEFKPTFRGRLLDNVPPLDPARVHQLAFMLADKTPGSFALEIDHVQKAPNETETR